MAPSVGAVEGAGRPSVGRSFPGPCAWPHMANASDSTIDAATAARGVAAGVTAYLLGYVLT